VELFIFRVYSGLSFAEFFFDCFPVSPYGPKVTLLSVT
jgi:hypothetical protein